MDLWSRPVRDLTQEFFKFIRLKIRCFNVLHVIYLYTRNKAFKKYSKNTGFGVLTT